VKAFLICPVRGHEETEFQSYVDRLEEIGFVVHFPPRDTEQNDQTGTGYVICQTNRAAIETADVVFIVWDGESQGSIFDLGMAFAMGKRIIPLSLPELTGHKSFQNMIDYMDKLQKVDDVASFQYAMRNMESY
jgi:nucleoside 2-deoxyribosyltransferase